jgi:tetratricopeptide (TPR) repeat protein
LELEVNERSGQQNPQFLRTLAQAYLRTGDSARSAQVWERAIALSADARSRAAMLNSAARDLLTVTPASLRDWPRGLEFAVQAARSDGANALHLNFAAWHLLTTPMKELRDPALALEFALKANELSRYEAPAQLDTLALAYHRTGETGRAIELQKKALSLLAADAADRDDYEKQLVEFERSFDPKRGETQP